MASNAASPEATAVPSPPSLAPVMSTAVNRPSLCMKPFPTATSPPASAGSPPASLTSKEWVIPPRPKPGRKPATDTPPTKRKAQNRAAQRAFRERRAARVGELEEQIKQIEDDHDQEQDELKATITKLEKEVERYRNDLTTWIGRCRQLEKELEDTKSQSSQQPASAEQHTEIAGAEIVGCGNCTLDTRCQCIDDAFDAMTSGNVDGDLTRAEKRHASPTAGQDKKRVKKESSDEMEIDFTVMYSRPKVPAAQPQATSPTSAVADPCGFCQDGTPCICAEMAAEQESMAVPTSKPSVSRPGHAPRQLAQFTPPPSEGDVAHASLPSSTRCASGPGTCVQCQADPNSTLFCKSLAASRSQSRASSGGCCGGKTADGGCCQVQAAPLRATRSRMGASDRQLPPLPPSKPTITLTCADAYTTLSRHPAYERASGEIATWMPKLYANPSDADGRPAMEIDAANVMAVLRDFDRRFGTDR